MAFFHCSLEVQCAIHCATEPGSGCFFYAPTATRTYLFPVCHRRPLRPLFTSSRGPTSVTTFDSSVGRAELNKQTSLGRWFDSGSKEELLFAGLSRRVKANGGQKNCFPDRESNPGRGAERAAYYTLDYQGEMGTVLLKSARLHLRFLSGCKGRSARLWTTQYVSILKSTPFWWASIPQPLKWPIPLLTRRSMRKRTRFWMLFYTYFPCFLRISIHILNLHNFGLLGDRKSIPTPVDSSHREHPVGPQRADEFRCRTDKGHFLHAPSQGWLCKQSGWPSGLRRCVQVAVSLEAWV